MAFDIIFLGGASEVGASCVALRFDDVWLIVDAGVRMSGLAEERLPDFSLLEGKQVAAIVVTHAHADHIGALPILHRMYPSAPIYSTSASIQLMTIMLADAIAVMEKRAAEELELPLYDSEAVEQMLQRLMPLPVDDRLTIREIPGLVISLRLAGHIAGAVSVGLEHPEGKVVISGDISVAPQRTIQGAQAPLVSEPDILILESTYGGREHATRKLEEQRLVAEVAEAIQRGGHVLIPAFALGRAQEVILILQEAQRRREIPHFTVWVDGLVRRVCAAYSTIPTFLSPSVRQRIVRGQPVFFTDTIHMVEPAQRKGILHEPPSCIIASSGMLTGGPSRWYAERLLPRPEATVALTGYQDEEAPGRMLQQVASGQQKTVVLGDQTITVAAKVTTYYLSGHADQGELIGFAQQIRPRMVALVHGDGGARNSLADGLRASGMSVVLPPTGNVLHVPTVRRAVAAPYVPPALPQRTRQATPDNADAVAAVIWEEEGRPVEPVVVEAREITRRWYGVEGTYEEIQTMMTVLAAGPQRFQPMISLEGFYRLMPPATLRQSAPVEIPRVENGSFILVKINGGAIVPWFCQRVAAGMITGVGPSRQVAKQVIGIRDVVAWIGHWDIPSSATSDAQQRVIDDWMLQSSAHRSHISARAVAAAMNPAQSYDLDTLIVAVGHAADDLSWRLHVALLIAANPRIFTLIPATRPLQDARWSVRLAAHWEDAHEEQSSQPRPDTHAIQQRIDWHLRGAKDLYRRSIDPDTGDITLRFRFPLTIEARYGPQIAALRAELPVRVEVGGETDHLALLNSIQNHLRPLVKIKGTPTVLMSERHVMVTYDGTPAEEKLQSALTAIEELTGFHVVMMPFAPPVRKPVAAPTTPVSGKRKYQLVMGTATADRCDRTVAAATAEEVLAGMALKIDLDPTNGFVIVRFPLPHVDIHRYAAQLEEVIRRTGWAIRVRPHAQHTALEAVIRTVVPDQTKLVLPLSIYEPRQTAEVRYTGRLTLEEITTAQTAFQEATGWQLILRPIEAVAS